MKNIRELIRQAAQRIMASDPKAAEGAKSALKDPAHQARASKLRQDLALGAGAAGGLEAMEAPDEHFGLETIVLQNGRPSLLIQDNSYNQQDKFFSSPGSEVWKTRLFEKDAKKNLLFAIPRVGRIDLQNNPDYSWVGTGWLVDEDIIITNRHVAQIFGRLNGAGFEFLPGYPDGKMSADIDFREEYEREAVSKFAVKDILYISGDDLPDMALLKIEQKNGQGATIGKKLPLAREIPKPRQFVATVGYPAADSRVPDHDLVVKFFGQIFDKKRLAPGQIIRAEDGLIFHDCSTLGGNSGSPVINYETGEIVGLHFSGLYLQENRGVSAPVLADIIEKVRRKVLPKPRPEATPTPDAPVAPAPSPAAGTKMTFQLQVPIELSITLGGTPVITGGPGGASISRGGDASGAARELAEVLGGDPNVLNVRPGYVFANGWITDTRAVVVVLKDSESVPGTTIPNLWRGLPVVVRGPTSADLVEAVDLSLEGVRATSYQEPTQFRLTPVNEEMTVLCHASPDAGWPTLKNFLAGTKKTLTIGMYDFTAPHIVDGVIDAVKAQSKKMTLVLQAKEALGGKIKDEEGDLHETEVLQKLQAAMSGRLSYAQASVGKNKQFASAYHIKVAVRDSKAFWLSSGNWQSTNQYSKAPEPNSTDWFFLENLNREWHVVIENENLAGQYEDYLNYDFKNASRDEAPSVRPMYLEIEEAAALEHPRGAKPTYFQPKTFSGVISVSPLLTPDNYQKEALALISSAKKSILFQNQSLNLQGRDKNGDDKNDPRFAKLYNTLLAKQKAGLDVRIIMRGDFDPTAYIELLKDLGFDDKRIKAQDHCHTKGIIVDGKKVLLGSHNWTNEGTLVNRDASLIFDHEGIAQYYADLFEFDWKNLARQSLGKPRRARVVNGDDNEAPPRQGWTRVAASDLH